MVFDLTTTLAIMTVKESDLGIDSSSDDDGDDVVDDRESIHVTFEAIKKKLAEDEIDLRAAAQLESFVDEYKDVLGETTSDEHYRRTLLHLLVDGAAGPSFPKYEPLVKVIIENHPDVLKKGDTTGRTSLYNAVTRKRSKLVQLVCNMHPDINSVLMQARVGNKETCIHAAIGNGLSSKLAVFLINKASEEVLCLQDSQGKTPLHLAVEYHRCTDEQLQIVQALAERGGGAMKKQTLHSCLSPYKYHMSTRAEAEKALKDAPEKSRESTQGKKSDGNLANFVDVAGKSRDGEGFKSTYGGELKTLMPSVASSSQRKGTIGEVLDKSLSAHQRRLSQKPESPTLPYYGNRNAELTHAMGERLRDSMDEDPKAKTKERNTKKLKDKDASNSRVTEASAEAIRNFLMLHCMRTMSTKDAEDFLYHKDQGAFCLEVVHIRY